MEIQNWLRNTKGCIESVEQRIILKLYSIIEKSIKLFCSSGQNKMDKCNGYLGRVRGNIYLQFRKKKPPDNVPFMRHEIKRKLPNILLDYGNKRFKFNRNQKISTDEIHCVRDSFHWPLNLYCIHHAGQNEKTYRIYRPQAEQFLTRASLKTEVGTADTRTEILKAFLLLWWVKKAAAIVRQSRCSDTE